MRPYFLVGMLATDVTWATRTAFLDRVATMNEHLDYAPARIVFDGTGEFLQTVRIRVREALAGRAPAGDPRLLRKAALITAWFLSSFVLSLSVRPGWLQLILCISYGLAASAVGFNIFHDANHGA